jgi:DNA-binding NtrC family response regulator
LAHVLMIDDDADFIEANRTVLEANGFEVSAAYSAQDGWNILQGATPDVIILDVMMEEFDSGFKLANDLNIRFPKMPVLLLTAVHDFMSDKWQFSREKDADWLPVIKFLEKPLAPDQLVAAIRDALAQLPPAK